MKCKHTPTQKSKKKSKQENPKISIKTQPFFTFSKDTFFLIFNFKQIYSSILKFFEKVTKHEYNFPQIIYS